MALKMFAGIEEVDVPEVKPQVKIAVKFTGICGTDLHEYLMDHFIPTETEHVYFWPESAL